jgi:hypothetical protein
MRNAKHYIFIFSLIALSILIHESGHLFFALLLGLPVDTFNLGFGPSILSFNIMGLDMHLRPIPFGGFVSLKEGFEIYSIPFIDIVLFSLGGILFNLITIIILTKFTLFPLQLVFKNTIKFNFTFFNEYFSLKKGVLLFFSAIGVLINIMPLTPLDSSKIVIWTLHYFEVSDSYITFYSLSSFSIFFLFFVYLNMPESIRHKMNILFKIDIDNTGFNYNYQHIKYYNDFLELYKNNYNAYRDFHKRTQENIDIYNDMDDISEKKKKINANKIIISDKIILERQEDILNRISDIMDKEFNTNKKGSQI